MLQKDTQWGEELLVDRERGRESYGLPHAVTLRATSHGFFASNGSCCVVTSILVVLQTTLIADMSCYDFNARKSCS